MVTKVNGSVVTIPTDPITKIATFPAGASIPSGSGLGLGGGTPSSGTLDFGITTTGIISYALNILARLTSTYIQFAVPVQIQNTTCAIYAGAGSPIGIVVAPPGSLYLNNAGGATTTLYVKESGIGASGWVAK